MICTEETETRPGDMVTYLVLAVDNIPTTANPSGRPRAVVAPARASLSIRTIAGHVTSIAAHTTNDVGRVVLLLRAIILAMADLAAVLAGLVLVIAQGSVEGSQFTELIALQFVLALGNRGSLRAISICGQDLSKKEALTVSMTLWISFLALLTFSSVSAIIRQCKSSSWLLE